MGRKIYDSYSGGESVFLIFVETELKGAFIIELEKLADERGFFARIWDQKLFEENGLNSRIVQCNISFNKLKGTIRGMHFQILPHEEAKVVSCIKGKIFDVIIDLRSSSETFKKWFSVELNDQNKKMLYIPEGFAHGFQTLEDNTLVNYQMSEFYSPEHASGVRWDDEAFQIDWPFKKTVISKKDLSYQPFEKGT